VEWSRGYVARMTRHQYVYLLLSVMWVHHRHEAVLEATCEAHSVSIALSFGDTWHTIWQPAGHLTTRGAGGAHPGCQLAESEGV
jgi:hypothetical protein